jgi:hypothetical protein
MLDHRADQAGRVDTARDLVGVRKQIAFEIRGGRVERTDQRRIVRRALEISRRPRPLDSKTCAISAIVNPSGKVTVI